MKPAKTLLFFLLSALYVAGMWLLLRDIGGRASNEYGAQVRNLLLGSLLAGYAFYFLQHFVTGKVAIEYVAIMPFINLITAFLIGAVLHVFGVDLSRNAFEQAGFINVFFTLIVALRLWRQYWMTRKTSAHAAVD
ncbi:MAG: hypothetical protein EOO08_02930 [Chitinophagaceae bacterium]|nr:MAG: hypothetical protein EOO08_02930 [Chitinophagaceae bacterium]